MYKKVTFINARGESVELFRQPLFLTRIEGLGDVDASIETQKSPNQDGSSHVSTTMNERAISIEIEILTDLREHRHALSRIFNPKLGEGTLIYDNGYITKRITAQSEHVPTFPDVRPKNTQTAMIDLICHDPYFRDDEDTRTDIAFWEPKFEFPLEIPEEGIEMGSRTLSTIVDVINDGHIDTGMIIRFEATSTVSNPYLTDVNTGESIKINRTLKAGEVVTINTNLGQKRIESTIDGVTTNIFNNIVFGSKFLQLAVGDNLFRFGADSNEAFLEVQIYHANKYAGV